jgi:RNA polymerase I-specific transcription initiation factor RRN7
MEFYLQEFKLTLPPLNHPPVMWKFLEAMSFPPEIYSVARKLANLLKIKEFGHIPEARVGGYPDSRLMALLIVACRLGYNLEKTRSWKDWAIAMEEEHGIEKGTAFDDVGEDDILGMSDEQLDGYMDWVQLKWVDEDLEFAGLK